MKRLLLVMIMTTSVAYAGTMHNGTWYGVGVPSRADIAMNYVSNVIVPPPVAPVVQMQYYTNPVPQPAPVEMPEPIIHSAVINGPYHGKPQDVFLTECMRYGFNKRQCMEIWGE